MRAFVCLLVLGAALAGAPEAVAQTPDLEAALQHNEVGALEAAASGTGSEAALARGVLEALHGSDEAALSILNAAAADARLDARLRRIAWSNIAAVHLRQGRFADTVAALEAAGAAAPAADAVSAQSSAQTLAFTRALVGVAPMTAAVEHGEIEIDHDAARLPRATIEINGVSQEVVLDTGANFSTITESNARRLGLRLLPDAISVGSGSSEAVAGHLGVAEALVLGGAQFHNVVFIVLPDDALSFAGGLYTIPAIVGAPVLRALGRIEFSNAALRYRNSAHNWNSASNLMLDGLEPLVVARVNGNRANLFLDSGARASSLSPLAVSDFPTLIEGAASADVQVGGAGGTRTIEDAPIIPRLTIEAGGRAVTLENVHVIGSADDARHGVIGQDVLRSGHGYVLDFGAMQFELMP